MAARPDTVTLNAVKEAIRYGRPVRIEPDGTVWINNTDAAETRDDEYARVDVRRGPKRAS